MAIIRNPLPLGWLKPFKERRQRKAEEGLRGIFQQTSDGLVIISQERRICFANPAATVMFRHVMPEMIGSVWPFDITPGRRSDNTLNTPWSNQKRWLSIGITSIRWEGRPAYCATVTDITAQKKYEIELEETKRRAEEANRAKSAFVANMSHEIRTPLGIVLGFADLLAREDVGADERLHYRQVIKKNGEVLLALINDILDLSKVESGQLQFDIEEIDFSLFLRNLISQYKLKAQERALSLEYHFRGKIPSIIQTDELRLRQILMNIIGNAIKFTKKGGITISVGLKDDKLEFLISDTGCGVKDNDKLKIFDPFMQANNGLTRSFGGTGLGLHLSRMLARALGGDVTLFASAPSRGSQFSVTINPGTLFGMQYLTDPWQAMKQTEASENDHMNNLSGAKVLVVEDALDNQMLIRILLERVGANVVTASNGQEAVEIGSSERFDVALMDIQMPVMDGVEAFKSLRQRGVKAPIVALTAHAMKGEQERFLSYGFNGYLTKPINQAVLINTVASFCAAP